MKNVESICSRLHINYDDGKSRKFEGYMESVLEKNKAAEQETCPAV